MTKITVRENHLFDNCTGIEDPINVHGTFQQVVAVSEDRRELTVRYMHRETAVRWKVPEEVEANAYVVENITFTP